MAGIEGMSVEQVQALAELAQGLSSDPKTRQGFLHLTKMKNPDVAIPEIDIPNSMRAAFAEPIKKLEALEKRAMEQDAERAVLQRRQALMEKGVTAQEIPKIEKLMVEKHIADHDSAIEFMRLQERAAVPTPASNQPGVRRFQKPALDLKDFQGDMKAWSRATAYGVIDELSGRKVAA